mmetsp:Transcript_19145/g.49433  ORF Transcript_19145/g.49433 Transcript_19145/m.49433 type:complete len:211 (+) Transcript_19145:388-1020(+)
MTCWSEYPKRAFTASEMRVCSSTSTCGFICAFGLLFFASATCARIGASSFSSCTALYTITSFSLFFVRLAGTRTGDEDDEPLAGALEPRAPLASCGAICLRMLVSAACTSLSSICWRNARSIIFSPTPFFCRILLITSSRVASNFCWRTWCARSSERLCSFCIFATHTPICSANLAASAEASSRISTSCSFGIGCSIFRCSSFFILRRRS